MDLRRRSDSTYIDLDITDGDAQWYCTDRYNASGALRLGGGRLRIRDVNWKGAKIVGFGETDYSLKVSSSPQGPQFWVSNQAGRETDIISLAIFLDDNHQPTQVDSDDEYTGLNKVTIKHTTLVCLDDPANTPFASMAWWYIWESGVYTFKVDITYLTPVYRWYEYVSNTGTDGACGTQALWKCDRVEAASNDHTSLGCRKPQPSNWLWDPADTTFKMYLKRGSKEQALVTVVADTAIPQLTNDSGLNLVITYHVTNDGKNAVQQSQGDTAHHEHTITIAAI